MKFKYKISKNDLLSAAPNSFKYFYFSLAIIIVSALIFLGWFIYQYFYQTITQAEEVIVLKREVAPDSIDLSRVAAVLTAIEAKNNAPIIDWTKVKNPFSVVVPEPPPSPVTTPIPAAGNPRP